MSTLSFKNIDSLRKKGIEVVDSGLIDINVTTKGMSWLLNYYNHNGNYGDLLTLKKLKEISESIIPDNIWRDLRIKSFPYEVYDDDVYYQLSFYLNGSPPKAVFLTSPNGKLIKEHYQLQSPICSPIAFKENTIFNIEFTKEQIEIINSGEMLIENTTT